MPPRVLIIDDEPEWRETFEDIFVSIGFGVDTVGGIAAAKSSLEVNAYELMVLDIFLTPGQAPLTYQPFLGFVNRSYPDMKVMATTGKRLPPNESYDLSKHGVVELIYKPQIQLDQLRAVVGRLFPNFGRSDAYRRRGSWNGQNCSVLLTDVAAFGAPHRTDADRGAIREVLYRILDQSLTSAGISMGNCHHEDRGDGVLIIVPPTVSTSRLVHPFLARLAAELSRHNDQAGAGTRFQLRAALDVGPVEFDEAGANGATLIDVARLVDSKVFKQRLHEIDGHLGIIASGFVYDRFIRHLHGPTGSGSYKPITDAVKEREFTAWIYVMGQES